MRPENRKLLQNNHSGTRKTRKHYNTFCELMAHDQALA